jgi:hypothetical protein
LLSFTDDRGMTDVNWSLRAQSVNIANGLA